MNLLDQTEFLLRITQSGDIVRRYFVVNGFDGAMTMLGLIIGFLVSDTADVSIIINVCMGAAVALAMSGISSAYISESAERKRALHQLEEAMIEDLQETAHGSAARGVPILVALVNGLAPLVISLLILAPLFLAGAGLQMAFSPLYGSVGVALALVFFLGVFLGRIAGISWIRSGIQTMLVAVVTALAILLLSG